MLQTDLAAALSDYLSHLIVATIRLSRKGCSQICQLSDCGFRERVKRRVMRLS
jgi:hypothetical protein